MNRIARLPVLAAVLVAMMVSLTGCDRLKARDQLNKGVASFKAGKTPRIVFPSGIGVIPLSIQTEKLPPIAVSLLVRGPTGTFPVKMASP